MRVTRFLLASCDDLHVLPLAALIPLLDPELACHQIRLDPRASDEENLDRFRQKSEPYRTELPLIIGGFSLGARIAARLSQELSATALVGLSYPFHRHGAPATQHGLAELQNVNAPTLIIQGSRDSHGNREQVRGMTLPPHVELHWLEGANHRWEVKGSGGSQQHHAERAARILSTYVDDLVRHAHE